MQKEHVPQDKYCDCDCHDKLGLGGDECPYCYFADGSLMRLKWMDRHGQEITEKLNERKNK